MISSFKFKDIYIVLLVLSFIRFFIDVNIISLGIIPIIFHLILLVIIFGCSLIFSKGLKRKDATFLAVIIFSQMLGYIYSYASSMENNRYYNAVTLVLGFFVYVRLPKKMHFNDATEIVEPILKFIYYAAVISTFYAMIFQLGKGVFAFRNESRFNIANIYSSFWGHRNQYATVLLGGFLASIYLIRNKKRNTIYKVFSAVFLINIVITLSRTVIASVFAFFVVCFFYEWKGKQKKGRKKRKGLLLFLVFIIGGGSVFSYFHVQKLRNFVDTYIIRSSSKLTGREYLWSTALSLIDIPTCIFGRGMGIDKVVLKDSTLKVGDSFHNIYLTYLVSAGIVIFIIFFLSLKEIVKSLQEKYAKTDSFLYTWLLACMVSFLTYGMFEASLFFGFTLASMMMTFFVFTIPAVFAGSKVHTEKVEAN